MNEDEFRGTGRTTNIVLRGVREALDHAGSPIFPRDHYDQRVIHQMVTDRISLILNILHIEHTVNIHEISLTVIPRK